MNTAKYGRKYVESHDLLVIVRKSYARIAVDISLFMFRGNGKFQRTFQIFNFVVIILNWLPSVALSTLFVGDIKHQAFAIFRFRARLTQSNIPNGTIMYIVSRWVVLHHIIR